MANSSRSSCSLIVTEEEGVRAGFGQTPSTISVLNVVRNELLGILKRAASRGQILDHCDVELMVEEAMLESNLVKSVDEILSNCNSISSIQTRGRNSPPSEQQTKTTENTPNTTKTKKANNMNLRTIGSSTRNLAKAKMLSTLSKKTSQSQNSGKKSKMTRDGEHETHYIVKKIIFDGLEELSYKYIADSSSDEDEDTTVKVKGKRDEMIKAVRTPKMEFGGSSPRDLMSKHAKVTQSRRHNDVAVEPKLVHNQNIITLVNSHIIDHDNDHNDDGDGDSDCDGAAKQQFSQISIKTKETVSIIRMGEIYVSKTKSKNEPNENFDEVHVTKYKSTNILAEPPTVAVEKATYKTSSSVVRRGEVSEATNGSFSTVIKTKKFEFGLIDKQLHQGKSCVFVKAEEGILDKGNGGTTTTMTPLLKDTKTMTPVKPKNIETQSTAKTTTATTTTTATMTTTTTTTTKAGGTQKLKQFLLKKSTISGTETDNNTNSNDNGNSNVHTKRNELGHKFTNFDGTYKTTLLKSKLNQERPEKLHTIKCKLNKMKSETVPPNREIDKFFQKSSKSEPERLHIIKAKLRRINSKDPKIKEEEEVIPCSVVVPKEADKKKPELTPPAYSDVKHAQQQQQKQQKLTAMSPSLSPPSSPPPPTPPPPRNAVEIAPRMQPIPVMSKIWQTMQANVDKTETKAKSKPTKITPANKSKDNHLVMATSPPIVVMSQIWMTTTPKKISQQRVTTLIQCQASLTVEKAAEPALPTNFDDKKSIKPPRFDTSNAKAAPPQDQSTLDLQAKMLTAEWVSITKQLQRDQLTKPSVNSLETAGKCIVEVQQDDEKPIGQSRAVQAGTRPQQTTKRTLNRFSKLKTPKMKLNWSTLGEKWEIEKHKFEQKPSQKKLSDNVDENSNNNNNNNKNNKEDPEIFKPTWSSLVRKWEVDAEQQQSEPQPTTLLQPQTMLSIIKSSTSTLCAKSNQALSAKASVLTLVPTYENADSDNYDNDDVNDNGNASETKSIYFVDEIGEFDKDEESPSNVLSSLSVQNGRICRRKKSLVSQIVNFRKTLKETPMTALQRRGKYLRTVKAMSFMLDASEIVKTIDGGLDEQDLLKFRWNLEYQKREEAKRKAGKFDAATTMLTNIAEPVSSEVQTQTELTAVTATTPTTPTLLPPLLPKAVASKASQSDAVIIRDSIAYTGNEFQKQNSKQSSCQPSQPRPASKANELNHNKFAELKSSQTTIPEKLTPLELDLLSKDYFTSFVDEIRELLQTTSLLSAKAFSSKPLTLWDVREAGRKVIQLNEVRTSLSVRRLSFFLNIDEALQKQIDIMKTIVAYGKLMYPHEMCTNPADEEMQLQKLLNEYQQKIAQALHIVEKKNIGNKKKVNEDNEDEDDDDENENDNSDDDNADDDADQIRPTKQVQQPGFRRLPQSQFINQYKLEMERRARLKAQAFKQQYSQSKMSAKNFVSTYPQKFANAPPNSIQGSRQLSATTTTVATNAASAPTSANTSYHQMGYISEISSDYVCKSRSRKTTKRIKKPKVSKPLDFILTGFKQSVRNPNNHIHDVHRRYHEQQKQLLQQEALLMSAAKRSKRSRKSKSNGENVSLSSPPPTVRVPAKNAPYKRTSYVLPVPPNQPTGWELFKWNCGGLLDNEANAHPSGSAITLNTQDRIKKPCGKNDFKSHAGGYGFQTAAAAAAATAASSPAQAAATAGATTLPIWK